MVLADTQGSLVWRVIERFYRSRRAFYSLHDRYEEVVQGYVEKFDQPREEIRLSPRELVELLSTQDLEELRDEYLVPLKEVCHRLFRTEDSTDFIDRLVNDIFHELSILKEEHYNVLTYGTDSLGGSAVSGRDLLTEQKAVLDEVHDMFPLKVHRIAHLYDVATTALEALLHRWKSDPVLIRSLFMHRDRFVAQANDDGLDHFYRLMYGPDQMWEGYLMVADSFLASGFASQAIEAYRSGQQHLEKTQVDVAEKSKIEERLRLGISRSELVLESSSIDDSEV
ncbi:MAG: hypothetical protein OSB09_08580 [Planctomycetota bacterium]|nr:hypothetical protein [Planctomycetota bacterium]